MTRAGGPDTMPGMASRKVIPIERARRTKRASKASAASDALLKRAAEHASSKDGAEAEEARASARDHRVKALQLEAGSGMINGPMGLHLFASIMHVLATGKTIFSVTHNTDWSFVVDALGLECSPQQLQKLWRVFEWLNLLPQTVLESAEWRLLDSVHAVVTGTNNNTAARRRVLLRVSKAVEFIHQRGPEWNVWERIAGSSIEDRLAEVQASWVQQLVEELTDVEPRFSSLQPDFVLKQLRATKPQGGGNRGGATNVAPALCAARLARQVGAFGDDEVSESTAKHRFLTANR